MSAVLDRSTSWLGLEELAGVTVIAGAALAARTTFKIGGPAELLVEASTEAAVREVARRSGEADVPLFVLGGGSNLLIADRGIPGIVLKLGQGFDFVRAAPNLHSTLWEVGAACSSAKALREAVNRGFAGLEGLAGVPGLLGGAIVMNAGGRDGSIGSAVRNVRVVLGDRLETLGPERIGFAYRSSHLPRGAILLAASLEVQPATAEQVEARVRAATERRRATQPLALPSAGSVFKNPPNDFAGRLIEAAGCKGWREGNAEVSDKHANFIVNRGGATACDVLRLVRRVRDRVLDESGIRLELEVKLVGDFQEEELP